MKIGIDARLWNQTGVGRYIRNLIVNLQKIDKKNDYVLFIRTEDQEDVKLLISNLKFQTLNCTIKWHSIEEQLRLPQIINKEKLDVMHFPYYSVPFNYKAPFVVTIHDLIPLDFQTGEASTLLLPLYKMKLSAFKYVVNKAARNAKKIIVPSNVTKKDVANYLNVSESKIKVIYEGVDKNLESKEISKKQKIILYVGNAYPHKNLETLFSAVKNLRIDGFKLILVGREDYFYKKMKRKVKELGLDDRIIFNGYASDKELSLFYKKAKILVTPSLKEGFGLSALEGLSNCCLVIASDIPVFHEILNDAAIYFKPNDFLDLSQKLEEAFLNEYQDKIKIGLERISEFSWQKTAKETLKIYESCFSLR